MISPRLYLPLLTALLLNGGELESAPAQRDKSTPPVTVSASGLFTAATPDTGLNSLLTTYGENFLQTFEKKFPGIRAHVTLIRFEVKPGKESVWNRQAFIFNNRLCFQLNINAPLPLDGAELDYQLAQILFLLMANGNRSLAGGEQLIVPPDWLAQGYALWTQPQAETIQASVLQPAFERQALMPLGELLTRQHPDKPGAEEEKYHAYSWLFVRALLSQPKAEAHIVQAFDFMKQGLSADAAFITAFPEINKPAPEREKWWLLQATRYFDLLQQEIPGFIETDKKLENLIHFTDRGDSSTYSLAELKSFTNSADYRSSLEYSRDRLRVLRGTAPAPYRKVIDEYTGILDRALKPRPEFPPPEQVQGLVVLRKDILKHEQSISDYLNWYLITQVPARRSATDRLVKTYQSLRDQRPGNAVRRYMNTVQKSRVPSGSLEEAGL